VGCPGGGGRGGGKGGGGGVFRWRQVLAATVRAHFVVQLAPAGDLLLGLCQAFKPVLVQALVPKGAVKALDVAVLHRLARLDQNVPDPVRLHNR
jgi:hypothetical protein